MNPPNLLIVMVDQMEAALLDRSSDLPIDLPHLQWLRDRSVQFTHAYCPAPICTPTRASFQLGQAVSTHGVIGNGRPMPKEVPTLADRLNAAGYQTGYVGKWHLDEDDSRGWQQFDEVGRAYPGDPGTHVMRDADAPHQGVAPYPPHEHKDGHVAARAEQMGRSLTEAGRPWALMVSFFGPHAPYYVPEPWYSWFDPETIPLPDDFDAPLNDKPMIQSIFRCRAWGQGWSEAKWRKVRAAYYGYCAMLDDFIGALLAGIDEQTAVLFLSDHGEMNGHLRMIYKGPMMYEQLVRVPVLLSLPGQTEARADDRLILTQDLTATLLSLAGAPSDDRIEGRDLLDPRSPKRDHVVSEFYEARWINPTVHQRVAMWRDRRWKYVMTENDGEELYDMSAALPEVENLATRREHTDRIKQMCAALGQEVAWVAATNH